MPSPTRAQYRDRLEKSRKSEGLAWKQADFWQSDAIKKAERLSFAMAACRHMLDLHGGGCACSTCRGARFALGLPSLAEQGVLELGGGA